MSWYHFIVIDDDYNETAAYISTDDCSPDAFGILSNQPLPVIRINSNPLCDLNMKPSPNIITYPRIVAFSDVLDKILSQQPWDTVQVFYSTQYG